ncbi:hypothetical protein ACFEMC_23310 (plasmid) [Kineococcus sp. DHX-1]|uniref:hypothetical protein n=1 Tax=Kineococcus sp. DHX-1 TaxID=3349638 RepID=UPI0036D2A235
MDSASDSASHGTLSTQRATEGDNMGPIEVIEVLEDPLEVVKGLDSVIEKSLTLSKRCPTCGKTVALTL